VSKDDATIPRRTLRFLFDLLGPGAGRFFHLFSGVLHFLSRLFPVLADFAFIERDRVMRFMSLKGTDKGYHTGTRSFWSRVLSTHGLTLQAEIASNLLSLMQSIARQAAAMAQQWLPARQGWASKPILHPELPCRANRAASTNNKADYFQVMLQLLLHSKQ
jgi:hypothetical protein